MWCVKEADLSHLHKLQSIVRPATIQQHHRCMAKRVRRLIAIPRLSGKVDGLGEVIVRPGRSCAVVATPGSYDMQIRQGDK